jgi:succinyl-CoA synthetase beta subunit/citryl-CoA synthetase large subunit
MRFFEYESRQIVKRAGIPTTTFGFATTPEEARAIAERIGGPTVIKSQVLTGGRMKAGGVKFADTADEAVAHDMTLAEINPLGELEDGSFVALDAHMDMENEARPRQKALLHELGVGDHETRQAREATPFELAGEEVDAQDHRGVAGNVTEFDGDLGLVIGAGGGSLTLFDAVRAHGGRPANYCEIGGNPSVAKACGLAKLVLQKPGVDKIAVMMSIVSNTRVDIVARGVIKACVELGHEPAEKIAIFRIPGAWEEEGFKILEAYGVPYADRSVSLNEAARRAATA